MNPTIDWTQADKPRSAVWHSEANNPPPQKVRLIDDTLSADAAYKLACEGTALLWQGDFQNAKHLLQALSRRIDNRTSKPKAFRAAQKITLTPYETFHKHRKNQIERARTLGMLLVQLSADYVLPYKRAPEVQAACTSALGKFKNEPKAPGIVMSLRELLGMIGAYEWRKQGVQIAGLSAKITPHYGVYSPVRGEYLQLIAQTPLPDPCASAFDIGTGTGVIAALLAQRGIAQIIATELGTRAVLCARENIEQLGLNNQVQVLQADLFARFAREGKTIDIGTADLIVCNPPWLPVAANSAIERAIYDPNSNMLRGFLSGVVSHLNPHGQAWLILSDLAEHLGLRTRAQLLQWFADANLQLIEKIDIQPQHGKTQDKADPLHSARAAEVTSLWKLKRND